MRKEETTMSINWKKIGLFAGGTLFGTAGIKILSGKDAKKVYTGCTAAVLRAKDCVMKTATTIQENAGDIYAEAKDINEARAAKEEEFELLRQPLRPLPEQALGAHIDPDGRVERREAQPHGQLRGRQLQDAGQHQRVGLWSDV